jgi:hypothetical protein
MATFEIAKTSLVFELLRIRSKIAHAPDASLTLINSHRIGTKRLVRSFLSSAGPSWHLSTTMPHSTVSTVSCPEVFEDPNASTISPLASARSDRSLALVHDRHRIRLP